jgi:large subunit ribosomal protein L21
MDEFACTRRPVLGTLALAFKRRGGKHSKHRKFSQPQVAPVCAGVALDELASRYFDGGRRMYAVIRAGGKQYRVAPGDVIRVEKLATGTDGRVEFPEILAVSGGEGQIGKPQAGARVVGQLVEEGRGAKILVFHYKRKKQYKKLRGHRQSFTAVRITEIAFDGQSFKAPELEKKQPKVKKAAMAHEPEHEAEADAKTAKGQAKKKAAPKKSAAKKPASKKK